MKGGGPTIRTEFLRTCPCKRGGVLESGIDGSFELVEGLGVVEGVDEMGFGVVVVVVFTLGFLRFLFFFFFGNFTLFT